MGPETVVRKALKLGASEAVAAVRESSTRQCKFVNNDVEVQKSWSERDVELFVSLGGSIAVSAFGGAEKDLPKFIKDTVAMARLAAPNSDYRGIAKGPFRYRNVKGFDKHVRDADIVEYANAAIESALASGAERCTGAVYSESWKSSLASSGSASGDDEGTGLDLSVRAFASQGSGHAVSVSRGLRGFDPSYAGEEAGNIASMSSNLSQGKEGTYDVLFGPLSIGNLLDNIGNALSAFAVEAGYSFFGGLLGKRVAPASVDIMDDGSLAGGYGSRAFDEEGVPTRRTKLIENGVLKTYLHSTSTAKKQGASTTGNAGIISPHPWNMILGNGKESFDGLLKGVRRGIYMTNVWYTRFSNYVEGSFSTIPRDGMFEIRDGELGRPITGLRLSDNVLNVLRSIDGIEKGSRQVKWWHEVLTPVTTGHVLCRKLRMTASK